jgi:CsoR family transcriptional regulator, copper-sensing transcriptional repressor
MVWVYQSPCDVYPWLPISQTMNKETKSSCLKRLNRIEGQVRGIHRMVEGDRYCIDVITQVSAVRAALKRVEDEVLKDHVGHCVEHAIVAGDPDEQRKKISELLKILGKM